MKSFVSILSFTLVVFGGHMAVMFTFLEEQHIGFLIGIHGFLLILLIVASLILKQVRKIDQEKVGMAFLAITIFKMIFAVVFIFVVKNQLELQKMTIVGNFFAAFFMYLIYEVVNALKELNAKE